MVHKKEYKKLDMKTEEQIILTTKNLLQSLGFKFEEVVCVFDEKHGMYICEIKGADSKTLIGREGETLDSINHLIRRICERGGLDVSIVRSIFLETNNFLTEKIKNLETVAHMMAERAKFFKKDTELDPMRSFERKIIHTFLEGKPNIKTESVGFGKDRRVVIRFFENN